MVHETDRHTKYWTCLRSPLNYKPENENDATHLGHNVAERRVRGQINKKAGWVASLIPDGPSNELSFLYANQTSEGSRVGWT